jgi:hypothetical protein
MAERATVRAAAVRSVPVPSTPSREPVSAVRGARAPGPTGPPVLRLVSGARATTPPAREEGIAELIALPGAGQPIAEALRHRLQTSMRADFSQVRVHTDHRARSVVDRLRARAFTYGRRIFLGSREAPTDTELIAHEAAHVIQQRGAPHVVQMAGGGGTSDALEREAQAASAAVVSGQQATVVGRTTPQPQFSFGDWVKKGVSAVGSAVSAVADVVGDIAGAALKFIKDKAANIPGYSMLGFALGKDPITGEPVPRNAINLIRAVMGLWPGGNLIFEALQAHGIIEKVGNWLDPQIATLKSIVGGIRQALDKFISTLGPSDLLNLGGAWERAKRIFSDPIDRAGQFVKGLASDVLNFIRDAILMPIAKLAEGTRGYDLLKAVLGKDPITGKPVPQDATTLIGGFLKLIGEDEIFENMKKANAIPRAFAWFNKALAELKAFVLEIPPTFITALKSLDVADMILIPRAFIKLGKVFGGFLVRFISWAGSTIWNLLEIIFEVVKPGALEYVKKTGEALKTILKNPLPFVGNLVKAAKLGFDNFKDNFWGHLKSALIDWLVGSLPGIYIPKSFDLLEIVKFVFSVLGLSWANIRAKLVKAVGETAVTVLEKGVTIVVKLVKEGPTAAWEEIKSQLTNLKDMVIDAIIGFVVESIVKKAVPKLIAMFIPGAGFISAIISIYDTVMVFVEKIATIIQVVKGFIDSIVNIANGVIDAAAKKVESTLAKLMSLAIAFLAGFLGLGKIADKVMGVIKKVQDVIDKALDKLIALIVTLGKKLFGAAKAGVKKLLQWWKKEQPFIGGGESHKLKFDGTEASAKLNVYSDKKPVTEFVKDFLTAQGTAAQIKDANDLDAKITATQQKLVAAQKKSPPDEAASDKLSKELDGHLAKLGTVLQKLLDAGEAEGSEKNPIQIDYPKRRASVYPDIYVGPLSQGWIPQTVLKQLSGSAAKKREALKDKKLEGVKDAEIDAWDGKVYTFKAIEFGKALPVPTQPVGLEAQFASIAPGKILVYDKKFGTGGGGKINALFRPYGFRPGKDGYDGDHVLERQLGGPDEIRNLWPLHSSENRSSGSTLNNMQVKIGKDTLSLPKARAKRKKDYLYLLIRSTKG